MKKVYLVLALIFALMLTSCGEKKSAENIVETKKEVSEQVEKNNTVQETKEDSQESVEPEEQKTETDKNSSPNLLTSSNGTVETEILIGDLNLKEFANAVDVDSKGEAEQRAAMMQLQEKYPKLTKVVEQNPMIMMLGMLLPHTTKIYYKGDMSKAEMEGVSYYGQNIIDDATQKGQLYFESKKNKSENVAFTQTPESMKAMFEDKTISDEHFDEAEKGTENYGGQDCNLREYTLKEGKESPIYFEKIQLCTTKRVPRTFNFFHPYYKDLDEGIIAIKGFIKVEDSDAILTYYLHNFQNVKIENEVFTEKETKNTYDPENEKEMMEGGMKMMYIMGSGINK